MICKREDLLLYAVTDRSWLGDKTLSQQVEEALQGGVTFVQLREKHLTDEQIEEEANAIKTLCKSFGVPFVINDNVEIAKKVDADGVHVGQSDMEAERARKILGSDKIIGVTARTVEQAVQAEQSGADYLGVGAAFQTGSKQDAKVISHETLRKICEAVRIPVIAIGGIDSSNVEQLAGTGICGIAAISGIFGQQDVKSAAARLRSLTEKTVAK